MTTNELKCPVCGKEMKLGEPETELYPALFSCENEECPIDEYFYEKDIQYINEAIQLRIDKEKAAAVQQERERAKIVYGIWQGFTHEGGGCDNNLYATIGAAQNRMLEIAKEKELKGIPDDCIWIKIEDNEDIGGWHMAEVDKDDKREKDMFEYETICIQQFNVT